MPAPARWTCAALLAGVALAAFDPVRARAYERQAGVAIGAGYAAISSDAPLPHHGLLLQAEGAIGLGDTWEFRALAGWALHPGEEPLDRVIGGVEIVYLVDVFQWVPFVGLGLDVPVTIHVRSSGTETRADFAAHFVVGLDWLPDRSWALGVELRPTVLLTSLPNDPIWMTVVARCQWLFEV